MLCPNCQFQNDPSAKFCGKCGGQLMAKVSPVSLPSVENLFRESFELYQKCWVNLLLIGLITVAAWTIWKIMVFPFILVLFGLGAIATGNLQAALSVGLFGLAVLILSWVVVFEIGFWGSAAGMVALEAGAKGEKAKLGEIYGVAKNLLWPLSIVSLLVFLVVGLGLLFFIIPGLILGFLLSFVNFVVVAERKTGLAVLKRSINLLWPNFWGVLGRDILILLAVGLVNIIFSRMLLFSVVSQVVVLPFVLVYHYLIYQSVSKGN